MRSATPGAGVKHLSLQVHGLREEGGPNSNWWPGTHTGRYGGITARK